MIALDQSWLACHPLPSLKGTPDKNQRGRLLIAGGSQFVPGALRLSGEAALRAGVGKLQMATVRSAAFHLGSAVPESAIIALGEAENGEIEATAAAALLRASDVADAFVLGPGIGGHPQALVSAVLQCVRSDIILVLDAAAIACSSRHSRWMLRRQGQIVLTPHHGEMAALTGLHVEEIDKNPQQIARDAAAELNAVVALKGPTTFIAAPSGDMLRFENQCPGLAIGGSGDVLAGIAGALAARGANPLSAVAWAVWLHGMAGQALAKMIGPVGFLARELPLEIPPLLAEFD